MLTGEVTRQSSLVEETLHYSVVAGERPLVVGCLCKEVRLVAFSRACGFGPIVGAELTRFGPVNARITVAMVDVSAEIL